MRILQIRFILFKNMVIFSHESFTWEFSIETLTKDFLSHFDLQGVGLS